MRTPSFPGRSVALSGAIAAGCWVWAHLRIHGPRGWPFAVLGEWDLLLPAIAWARGEAVPTPIAAIHGGDFGAAWVSALVGAVIRTDTDPLLAGKWVAAAFGAVAAGIIAATAVRLTEPVVGERRALAAGVVAGLAVALAWPGLHFELAGLSGRTPEALPFQLLACFLVLGPSVRDRDAALAGVAIGPALTLSPVAVWTLGTVALALLRGASPAQWIRRLGYLGIGLVLPILFLAAVMPSGWEGLGLFLADLRPGSGTHLAGPGPQGVLGSVRRALEGGAHQPELSVRAWVLGLLGWGTVFVSATLAVRAAWSRRWAPRDVAAGLAVSWIVPLSLLPTDTWFYPLAYRYWCASLGLALALLVALAGSRRGGWGTVGLVGLGLLALLPLPSLDRSILAPAPSPEEAMVNAGAHRLDPRPGRPRHDAFLWLTPSVPPELRSAWLLGYGGALGLDLVADTRDERAPITPWEGLDLSGPDLRALALGVGCGFGTTAELPQAALAWVAGLDLPLARSVLYGLASCGGDPTRPPGPGPRSALVAGPALGEAGWRTLGRGLLDAGVPMAELPSWAPSAPNPAAGWLLDGAAGSPWPATWRPAVPHPAGLLPVRP